jgi:5-methylcytosine-specific restriction endonuclease McrA
LKNRHLTIKRRTPKQVSSTLVFLRDSYTCQYCGFIARFKEDRKQLTVDHLKPVHSFSDRQSATTWENVTTACYSCNQKKGGSFPEQCGMVPLNTPSIPDDLPLRFNKQINDCQRVYLNKHFKGDYSNV